MKTLLTTLSISAAFFASAALASDSISSDGFDWSAVPAINDGVTVVPAIAPELFADSELAADDALVKGKRIKNTKKYPASARVLIEGQRPDGSDFRCTGTMVGYKTVLTAGDCVYSRSGRKMGWNNNVKVYAGKNGKGKAKKNNPYGVCKATNYVSPRNWVVKGHGSYNYGVAILDCEVGRDVGTYGFEVIEDALGENARIAGYPAKVKSKHAKTQWRYRAEIAIQKGLVFHYNLKDGKDIGNIGAAVTTHEDEHCGPCVQGVTSYIGGKSYYDYGPFVSKQMYDHIREWKKHYGDKEGGL